MRAALAGFGRRLAELVRKLVSVKGLAAGVCTGAFWANPGSELAFWAFVGSWALLIGAREVYKIAALLKGIKSDGGQ